MKENPFEKIGGYANIDISDIFNIIKNPEHKKTVDSRVQKLWDEFGKIKSTDEEETLRYMSSILAIDPKDFNALQNNAISLGRLGRNEEMLEHCDELLKIKPDDSFAWCMKALTHLDKDADDKILGYFDKAIDLCANPDQENMAKNPTKFLFVGKANMLAHLGRFKDALKYFEKALDIDGEDYLALVGKGDMIAEFAEDEGHDLTIAIGEKEIVAARAKQKEKEQKTLEKALEFYDKAIKINDKDPVAWISKGMTLARLGGDSIFETKKCFVKALELDPKNGKIKQMVETIEKHIEKQIEKEKQASIEQHEEEIEQEKLREEQYNYENRKKFGL